MTPFRQAALLGGRPFCSTCSPRLSPVLICGHCLSLVQPFCGFDVSYKPPRDSWENGSSGQTLKARKPMWAGLGNVATPTVRH